MCFNTLSPGIDQKILNSPRPTTSRNEVGEKSRLDEDLAELYGVETRILTRAVKRNIDRFPGDFMFQLENQEVTTLRSQIGISKNARGGRRYLPYVFTEHGIAMLSSVLRSREAIQVNALHQKAHLRKCVRTLY